jgi:hypothetical protein
MRHLPRTTKHQPLPTPVRFPSDAFASKPSSSGALCVLLQSVHVYKCSVGLAQAACKQRLDQGTSSNPAHAFHCFYGDFVLRALHRLIALQRLTLQGSSWPTGQDLAVAFRVGQRVGSVLPRKMACRLQLGARSSSSVQGRRLALKGRPAGCPFTPSDRCGGRLRHAFRGSGPLIPLVRRPVD